MLSRLWLVSLLAYVGAKPNLSPLPLNVKTLLAPMWKHISDLTETRGDLTAVKTHPSAPHSSLVADVDQVKATTECSIRLLAYEYALQQLPQRAPLLSVFDGLELDSFCNVTRPEPVPLPPPSFPLPPSGQGVYVDYLDGSDDNAGTKLKPLRTVGKAVQMTRQTTAHTIVLREGTHFLTESVLLGVADSGLTIMNYPGEEVWVSGGVPLKTNWMEFDVQGDSNIYVTDIDPSIKDIPGLMTQESFRRLIRARFPNAIPEDRNTVKTLQEQDGLLGYVAPAIKPKAEQVWLNLSGIYDRSLLWQYNGYANGICKHAGDPNCPCGTWKDVRAGVWSSASYHCAENIGGGWENMDQGNGYYHGPILPLGLRYNTTAGSTFGDRVRKWADPEGAVVVAWRQQGWFVNMYQVSSVDPDRGVIEWVDNDRMPQGGWQGGRGWQLNGTSGDITPNPPFFVENILEELDFPDEWFFDKKQSKLYYWNPDDGPPARSTTFVATALKELIGIRGDAMEAPIRDISILGLCFRDARATFMEPWGVPSGGDWAMYRGAAMFIENAEGVRVESNLFKRVDGNGVFLSGYTRNVSLLANEFAFIGDTAMVGWGYTDEHDGTKGEQPRDTLIADNVAHEVGYYQLQSSMWFQAKTALTTLRNNIFFNGPRSGINFNDGFGGGNVVERNLIFNQCRHSGDHGPINSWERGAYLSDVRDGTPSWEPKYNDIASNFIIANYGGSQGFDNDDGSSWYNIHHNFIYGEGLKQDYGGHDSRYHNNVNVVHKYDGQNCLNTWPFINPYYHNFTDNKCVVLYTGQYGSTGACQHKDIPGSMCVNVDDGAQCMCNMANNDYYTPFANATLSCDDMVLLEDLQAGGVEMGSTNSPLPSNDDILSWARDVLGM